MLDAGRKFEPVFRIHNVILVLYKASYSTKLSLSRSGYLTQRPDCQSASVVPFCRLFTDWSLGLLPNVLGPLVTLFG
jgi:hypothetical protein